MVLNKKGVFFTVIVILIASLFFFSYTLYTSEKSTAKKRVQTLDSFIFSIEQDLSRQLYIAGYRFVFIIEQKIIENGFYEPNVTSSMSELINNGSIRNESQPLMIGVTLPEIQALADENARRINANINITSINLSIKQDDPWNINLILTVRLIATDDSNVASWDKTEVITAVLPIEFFEDPLYLLNTNGQITNKFVKSPYDVFVSESNVENLTSQAINSYYIASSTAPSFINRLEGRNTPDINGVESLVNIQELVNENLQVQQKSIVDYIYFSASNPSSHRITGTPPWFYLDTDHLDDYQATSLAQ